MDEPNSLNRTGCDWRNKIWGVFGDLDEEVGPKR